MKLTPKEKAEELYDLFSKHAKYWDCYNDIPLEINHTKQSALIAVDEILNILNIWDSFNLEKSSQLIFWQEVKEELLKM